MSSAPSGYSRTKLMKMVKLSETSQDWVLKDILKLQASILMSLLLQLQD